MVFPPTGQLQAVPETKVKRKNVLMPRGVQRELLMRPLLTGWTPQKVENARQLADGGNLLALSDLVETMFRDDRITGVLSTRTHGLLGLPIDFIGGDPQLRKLLAGDDLGKTGEWWNMHDESELAKLQAWGLVLGVGLAHRIPLPRIVGQPQRYRIETWSPRWLSYYQYLDQGTTWRVITQDGQFGVVPGDGEWILYLPYGARRPWAEGLWKALAFPWLLKQFSLEDRANYSEVLGAPIWVGTAGVGSNEKQRNTYLSQLQGLGKNGKLVLPNGFDLQLREATGKSYEIYEGQIEWADTAMTIVLAGQTVTTEGTTGFSGGDIQERITQDLIRFDSERLSSCLYQQSLKPLAMMNYGDANAAPRPEWQTEKAEDASEKAAGLSALGDAVAKLDAALKVHGLKANAVKIMADFNVPVVREPAAAPSVPAPSEKPAVQPKDSTI